MFKRRLVCPCNGCKIGWLIYGYRLRVNSVYWIIKHIRVDFLVNCFHPSFDGRISAVRGANKNAAADRIEMDATQEWLEIVIELMDLMLFDFNLELENPPSTSHTGVDFLRPNANRAINRSIEKEKAPMPECVLNDIRKKATRLYCQQWKSDAQCKNNRWYRCKL